MSWVFIVAALWLLLALAVAVLLGWSVRLADRKVTQQAQVDPNFVVDVLRPPGAPHPRAAARADERPTQRAGTVPDGGDPRDSRPDRDVEMVPVLPSAHPGVDLRPTWQSARTFRNG